MNRDKKGRQEPAGVRQHATQFAREEKLDDGKGSDRSIDPSETDASGFQPLRLAIGRPSTTTIIVAASLFA